MQRGVLSFAAYEGVLPTRSSGETFLFSNRWRSLTIIASLLLIVPTAYWVHLRVPQWRPVVEFITLMPFVIPAIVLRLRDDQALQVARSPSACSPLLHADEHSLGTNVLLVAGYIVLSLPYMYRAVDTGLRAMDVRTLTEAAQSLGAGWFTILCA